MANIGLLFDATAYDPAVAGVSQLPVSDAAGWPCVITASEMKETKDKTGGYLELTFQIIEGAHKGEEGSYRINLFNKNKTATDIAYRQLSAVCYCVGTLQVQDSAQLHNKPLRAVVRLQKSAEAIEKGYTEIAGVLRIDGTAPSASAPPVQAAAPVIPPAQPAAPAQPAPWAPPAGVQEAPAAPAPWAGAPATGAALPWQK